MLTKVTDDILFIDSPAEALEQVQIRLQPDKFAFLVDENTRRDCLPLFEIGHGPMIIEIPSGEKNKNIRSCEKIWEQLTDWEFTRKSVLINVGGGVIGDMGGFAAATYKRGIRFVNFPTTLLAMVDANIGGKLGIDFKGFKNHIGVFQDPELVLVYDQFLKTLPPRELRSGFAEVIKHGLIKDKSYWEMICSSHFPNLDWKKVVEGSIFIKKEVVQEDPRESGLRKILNFGHTLGHAVETWYLNHGKILLHGEAIATGMILEVHLSAQLGLLEYEELEELRKFIFSIFEPVEMPPLEDLLTLMKQDKKNLGNEISFSLLDAVGNCRYDQLVEESMIASAIEYYRSLR